MSISPPPAGGYVPPGAPARRSGGGCWVWGFMSCLVVFIVIASMVAYSVYSFSKTKQGKQLFGSVGTAMKSTQGLGMCEQKMKDVNAALGRYHDHTGHYPPDLKALVPVYLADQSSLHCSTIDTNPDPSHVTFEYTRPADNAPGSTPVLSFHWKYTILLGDQKNVIDTEFVMLLNGTTESNQTQSAIKGAGTSEERTTTIRTTTTGGTSVHVTTQTGPGKTTGQ